VTVRYEAAPPVTSPAAPRAKARYGAALLVAALIAVFAFGFRFNTLGGSLGGFDNDHYVHLLRTEMLLHGEQPLRDFAEAELRGAWPSLGYAASAWAQQLWGPTLLSEAYLTVGGLALAAAVVFLVAFDVSKRWLVALLATLCVIASGPKLYNYEKVLVLAMTAALVRLWIVHPTWPRLLLMAIGTAVATLFRHDFGVYVAIASGSAILVRGPGPWTAIVQRVGAYVGITTLLLLPSIVWVQVYQGVVPYVQAMLATIDGESLRTDLPWPTFELAQGVTEPNLVSLTYYAFWAIPILALVVLPLRLFDRGDRDRVDLATGVAMTLLALAVNTSFLRGSLLARFGDAIVPVALLAAWTTASVPSVWHVGRSPMLAAWIAPRALLLVIFASAFTTGDTRRELSASGLTDSWEFVQRRFRSARSELLQLPPRSWSGIKPESTLVAARYVAECTSPEDHLLVVTYAPEVPVFARRRFAAGQGTFGLNFYTAEEQQRAAVDRLRTQSVPVVLGSFEEYEGEFVEDYPIVAQYVAEHYRPAGTINVDGEPRFRVLVATNRQPSHLDATLNLPCYR
jgi:hypothetical protein